MSHVSISTLYRYKLFLNPYVLQKKKEHIYVCVVKQ